MKKIVLIIITLFFMLNLYAVEKKLLIDDTIKVNNKNKNIKLFFESDGFYYKTFIEIEDKKVFEYEAVSIDFKIVDFNNDNNEEIAIMFAHGKGDLLDFFLFNVDNKENLVKILEHKDLYKGGFSIEDNKLTLFKAYPEYNYLPPHFYIRHEFDIEDKGFGKVKAFPELTDEINVLMNYSFYLKRKNKIEDSIKELEKIVNLFSFNEENQEILKDTYKELLLLSISRSKIDLAKKYYNNLKEIKDKKYTKELLEEFLYLENKKDEYIEILAKKQKAIDFYIDEDYKEVILIYEEILEKAKNEKELYLDIKYRLALAYNSNNEKDKANKLFKEIIELNPNSDEAKFSKEFIK